MILEWVGNEVRGLELGNINGGNVTLVTFLLSAARPHRASESPSVKMLLSENKYQNELVRVKLLSVFLISIIYKTRKQYILGRKLSAHCKKRVIEAFKIAEIMKLKVKYKY